MTRVLMVMAAAVALLALSAAPAAAGAWLAPASATPAVPGGSGGAQAPSVAVNSRGDTLVVFTANGGNLFSSFRPAGSPTFQTVQSVPNFGAASNPRAALDPQGNAVVAVMTSGLLRVAARPAGGSWIADPVPSLAASPGSYAVAIDASGNAVVVWSEGAFVYAQTRPAGANFASGVFGSEDEVGNAGTDTLNGAQIAMNAAGTAVVAWHRVAGAFVEAAVRPAGASSFAAPQTVAAATSELPDVGIDAAGNAVAVYRQSSRVGWATRPAGAVSLWSTGSPALISPAGTTAAVAAPQVAVDSAGNAVAAWQLTSFTPPRIQGAFRPAGGAFDLGTTLSDTALTGAAPLAAVSNGVAMAAWTQSVTGGQQVQARVFSGSWGGVLPASATHLSIGPTALAMDDQGNGSAAWEANAAPEDILVNVFDGAGPTLTMAPPNPLSATLGTAFSFAVSASDRWSAVDGQPSWNFGDGASAQGESVQHTYASAGTFAPVVTARDVLGNTSSASTSVTVTPAQAPPPPPPGNRPLPPPVLAKFVNATPVSGTVRVRLPGTRAFVPLAVARQIPIGSIVDARKGRVRITGTDGRTTFSADFYEGMFRIAQRRRRGAPVDIILHGGSFRGCPRAPKAQLSARSKKRSVRHLWGDGKGKFRTAGRFSSATLRGTKWLTDDRCNGTRTRVAKGAVNVRDFVKRKTIVVRAGRSYFAQPRRR